MRVGGDPVLAGSPERHARAADDGARAGAGREPGALGGTFDFVLRYERLRARAARDRAASQWIVALDRKRSCAPDFSR